MFLEGPQQPQHLMNLDWTAEYSEGSHFQVKSSGLKPGHGKKKKKKGSFEMLLREARSRGVYSDEMETELSARKQSALSGGNWAQLITHLIALLPRSMVVAVSCCGGAFEQKGTADS